MSLTFSKNCLFIIVFDQKCVFITLSSDDVKETLPQTHFHEVREDSCYVTPMKTNSCFKDSSTCVARACRVDLLNRPKLFYSLVPTQGFLGLMPCRSIKPKQAKGDRLPWLYSGHKLYHSI